MYVFKSVSDIVIKTGAMRELARLLDLKFSAKRAFVVTGRNIYKAGLLDQALASLEEAGINAQVFSEISADPPQKCVETGAKMARAFDSDLVIGFGGGSVMDAAKIIATAAQSSQPIDTMYGVDCVKGPRLPLVLIPTTAGTGSEVTNVAILTTQADEKKGIVSDVLYADQAILDAKLSVGLPQTVTAATGIDAMVHAIEAYTSVLQKNAISDNLAQSALVKLHAAIERVLLNPEDLPAREDMLIGAMMAGQAFSNAPCGAIHALAYPLGGFYQVPHGLSNALVLTEVLKYNLPKASQYYGELASMLGLGGRAHNLIDEMERLKDVTGVPQTLREVNIPQSAIPVLVDEAMKKTRLLMNNPRKMTIDAAHTIYATIAG